MPTQHTAHGLRAELNLRVLPHLELTPLHLGEPRGHHIALSNQRRNKLLLSSLFLLIGSAIFTSSSSSLGGHASGSVC